MQNQYPDGKRFAEILDNLIFCLKTDLNNLSNSAEILIHLGSPSRTRTYDPRINSPLLYQLSYRGIIRNLYKYNASVNDMYKVVVSQFESYIFDRSSILFYNRVMNKPKRPRDPNQLAKLIVDIATGEAIPPENEPSKKNPAAVALGQLGGGKGREGSCRKAHSGEEVEYCKESQQKKMAT